MLFCNKCGAKLDGDEKHCPFCGALVNNDRIPENENKMSNHGDRMPGSNSMMSGMNNTMQNGTVLMPGNGNTMQNQAGMMSAYSTGMAEVDDGGFIWGALGFFISFIGIILYFMWRDEKPNKAKSILVGSIISIEVLFIIVNLFLIF